MKNKIEYTENSEKYTNTASKDKFVSNFRKSCEGNLNPKDLVSISMRIRYI